MDERHSNTTIKRDAFSSDFYGTTIFILSLDPTNLLGENPLSFMSKIFSDIVFMQNLLRNTRSSVSAHK